MKPCILIPAHNEEIVLQRTLNSLYDAGFDPDTIYCVDDFSTDKTYDICIENKINVCRTPLSLGKAGAQQYAINHFQLCEKYRYVIMIDADTKVDKSFRDVLIFNFLWYSDVDLFIGQVTSSRANHVYSAYRTIEYTFSHEIIKKGQDNFGVIYVAPGCVSVYSTAILRHLDFDTSMLTEDMDLTIQVHKIGGKIKYLHDARVLTQDPSTFKDYHKQMIRWYSGFWQVILKYTNRKNSFKRVDLYLLYLILDSLIFNRIIMLLLSAAALTSKAISLILVVDLCIFALVTVYASYKNKRDDLLLRVPILYLLSFFNTYVYIRSFFEVIVFRKKNTNWNKVKRYGE